MRRRATLRKAKPPNFVPNMTSPRFTPFLVRLCVAGGLVVLGTWCVPSAWAQSETKSLTGYDAVYGDGVDLVLTDAARFHVTLHSQGAGLGFQRGKFDGAFALRGWQAELVFVRHPKEEKTRNPVYEESLPYVYGKVNAHHALRIQRFKHTVLAEKYRKSGVTVSRATEWGLVVGIAKPVFLEIGYPEIPYTSLQVEQYDPAVHFSDRIYGRAPWVNGLEMLSVNPGLGWGEGMAFEFHDSRTTTRTLDAAVRVDAYLKPVEILASEFVTPRRVQVTFLLRYAGGAQWSAKGLADVPS